MPVDASLELPPRSIEVRSDEVVGTTRAMATDISVRVPAPLGVDRTGLEVAVDAALRLFQRVETVCTRFNPRSPLMEANQRPDRWQRVHPLLFEALQAASFAHRRTGGRFDPRVLADLIRLGYDRSLPFVEGAVVAGRPEPATTARRPWNPLFDADGFRVHLQGEAVELGGIGKGLAVRWASAILAQASPHFLVEAGGDCYCAGRAPGGEHWRVGVEDPLGGAEPVAVVELCDQACTTSSIRLRRWTVKGQKVHHLIDPRSGQPGGEGLLAVTVIDQEPAMAEVWSKTLFLAGTAGISAEAGEGGHAALWVTAEGRLGVSAQAERSVLWTRPGVRP